MIKRIAVVSFLLGGLSMGGCAFAHLAAGMMQNAEYQKRVQKPAEYAGLEGHTVAVLVDVDMTLLYEHPALVQQITGGVTLRIGRDVPDVLIIPPAQIVDWQWRTPQWNAMSYGEWPEVLGVDRVVYVDIYEYRLNPPGNRWLWEGVCAASVSIVERDSIDPDSLQYTFDVMGTFPNVTGVDRSQASEAQIATGVLAEFIKKTRSAQSEQLGEVMTNLEKEEGSIRSDVDSALEKQLESINKISELEQTQRQDEERIKELESEIEALRAQPAPLQTS